MAASKPDPPWKSYTNADKSFVVKSRIREYSGEPIASFPPVGSLRKCLGPSPSARSKLNGGIAPEPTTISPSQKRSISSQGMRGPEGAHWAVLAGGALAAAATVIGRKRRKSLESGHGIGVNSLQQDPARRLSDAAGHVTPCSSGLDVSAIPVGIENSVSAESPTSSAQANGDQEHFVTPQSSPLASDESIPRSGGGLKRGLDQDFHGVQNSPQSRAEDKPMTNGSPGLAQLSPAGSLASKLDPLGTPGSIMDGAASSRSGPGTGSPSKREAIQRLRAQLRSREEIIYEMQAQITEQDKNAVRQTARCEELEAALRAAHNTHSDLAEENARLRQKLSGRSLGSSYLGGRPASSLGTPLGTAGAASSEAMSGISSDITMAKPGLGSGPTSHWWVQNLPGLKDSRMSESPSVEAHGTQKEKSEVLQAAQEQRERRLQQEVQELKAEVGRLEKERAEQQRVGEHAAEGREEALERVRQSEQEVVKALGRVRQLEQDVVGSRRALEDKDRKLEEAERQHSQLASALAELERKVQTQAVDMEALMHRSRQPSLATSPVDGNPQPQGNNDLGGTPPPVRHQVKQALSGSRRVLWPENKTAGASPLDRGSPPPPQGGLEQAATGSHTSSPTLSHSNPLAWLSPPERRGAEEPLPRSTSIPAAVLLFSNPMAEEEGASGGDGLVTLAALRSAGKGKQSVERSSKASGPKPGLQNGKKLKRDPVEELKTEQRRRSDSASTTSQSAEKRVGGSVAKNERTKKPVPTDLTRKSSNGMDDGDLLTAIQHLRLDDSSGGSASSSPRQPLFPDLGPKRVSQGAKSRPAEQSGNEPTWAELKRKVGLLNGRSDAVESSAKFGPGKQLIPAVVKGKPPQMVSVELSIRSASLSAAEEQLSLYQNLEEESRRTSQEIRRLSASLLELSPYGSQSGSHSLEEQMPNGVADAVGRGSANAASSQAPSYPQAEAAQPDFRYVEEQLSHELTLSGNALQPSGLRAARRESTPSECSAVTQDVEDWEDSGWSMTDELARLEAELQSLNDESEFDLIMGGTAASAGLQPPHVQGTHTPYLRPAPQTTESYESPPPNKGLRKPVPERSPMASTPPPRAASLSAASQRPAKVPKREGTGSAGAPSSASGGSRLKSGPQREVPVETSGNTPNGRELFLGTRAQDETLTGAAKGMEKGAGMSSVTKGAAEAANGHVLVEGVKGVEGSGQLNNAKEEPGQSTELKGCDALHPTTPDVSKTSPQEAAIEAPQERKKPEAPYGIGALEKQADGENVTEHCKVEGMGSVECGDSQGKLEYDKSDEQTTAPSDKSESLRASIAGALGQTGSQLVAGGSNSEGEDVGAGERGGDSSDSSLQDMLDTMLDDMAHVCAHPPFLVSSPKT